MQPQDQADALRTTLIVEAYKAAKAEGLVRIQTLHQTINFAITLIGATVALSASLASADLIGAYYPWVLSALSGIASLFGLMAVAQDAAIIRQDVYIATKLMPAIGTIIPETESFSWLNSRSAVNLPRVLRFVPSSFSNYLFVIVSTVSLALALGIHKVSGVSYWPEVQKLMDLDTHLSQDQAMRLAFRQDYWMPIEHVAWMPIGGAICLAAAYLTYSALVWRERNQAARGRINSTR